MGYIAYEGPSCLNGERVVAVITGVDTPSHNPKTGPMVQAWILVADTPPHDAVRRGADAAVCGGCVHRGRNGVGRSCYVVVQHAPLTIWRTWQRGEYRPIPPQGLAALGRRRLVRLGAYGDPAAVPIDIWDALLQDAAGWTGYTHQWASPRLRAVTKYCAASVDSPEQLAHAVQLGLSTFRVLGAHDPYTAIERACPSQTGMTCAQCLRCQGTQSGTLQHIAIPAHGIGASHFNKMRDVDVNLIVPSGDFGHTTGVDGGCTHENQVLTVV